MSSAMFVALIAASEMVSASNHVARPNHIHHRQTDSYDLNPNQCFYPSTLATPTGRPTPAPALSSVLATVVDGCNIGYQPASITSAYSSFSSAYNSWVNAHSASLLSLGSFVYSYEVSISTQSQCTQYYLGLLSALPPQIQDYYFCGATSGTDVVTGSTSGASVSSTPFLPTPSSGSSTGATASPTASSSSATTTTLGTSSNATGSSITASAATNTNAAKTSFGADGAVFTYFLITGATIAISAFIGMIAL